MDTELSIEPTARNRIAVARSIVYKTFAALFCYPGEANWRAGGLGLLMPALSELSDCAAFRTFSAGLKPDDVPDPLALEAIYTRLFIAGTHGDQVPLREASYLTVPEKEVWEDAIRFYEHFGLDYDLETTGELPDNLLVELDFMHFLSFVEAGAEDPRPLLAGQRDFVEKHLIRWLPQFATAIANGAEVQPYALYAETARQFVTADLVYLRGAAEG